MSTLEAVSQGVCVSLPDEGEHVGQHGQHQAAAGVAEEGGSRGGVARHEASGRGLVQVDRPARPLHHRQHGLQAVTQLSQE